MSFPVRPPVFSEPSLFLARYTPRLVQSLRDGSAARSLVGDLIAGVTVGLVALPLAMAFGISSKVTPEAGIYTAIVAGFLISALGGSRVQIGGPTGAFVVIVAGIIDRFGLSGLLMATLMAGLMLVGMGLSGLGKTIRFIPRPVTIGFTNGIAVLIASTQIKDFLGLQVSKVPGEFLERMRLLAVHLSTTQWPTLAVSGASLLVILLWPRLSRRLPGTVVALVLATTAVAVFHLPVDTIGSRFGGIPQGLPAFRMPTLDPSQILPLLPSAVTIALLAAIESLLSAVVADRMSGDRHNPDMELVAQGVANLAVPFVGGIPATGAIARTATNVRSGAKTPISGVIHAVTLLMVILFAARLSEFVPLATLAAVLFVVAYNMGEWHEIKDILQLSRADISVWAATFLLTVIADLTVAVEVGMVLAALLHIGRVAQTTTVEPVTEEYLKDSLAHSLQTREMPPYVTILRIHGPFLFGTTEKLDEATEDLSLFQPIVILRLRNMTALDGTGLHSIENLADRLHASGKTLLLEGMRNQPASLIRRSRDLAQHVGEANILPHIEEALARAEVLNETTLSGQPDRPVIV
ncbi:MAG: SulP family inorganic anion transporter [Capsulimonadales bacterium]|nr:SulP family inorganic anion transporter [Capsulimonadales bacterium]